MLGRSRVFAVPIDRRFFLRSTAALTATLAFGFVRPVNRLAFFAVAEAFLAKHLGGRCQPFEGDLSGSTMKVEVGAELVPGLVG
jgi:hypothetical protein